MNELDPINAELQKYGYKVLKKLSDGTSGEVYAVIDDQQRPYAIKIMEKRYLKKLQKEYEAILEGEVLRKLHHPGIVEVKETIIGQRCYMNVMQICPYGTINILLKILSQADDQILIKKKSTIIKYYLAQLVETISNIHDQGLIHRDLKFQNLMLGIDMKLRICDFGSVQIAEKFFSKEEASRIRRMVKEMYTPENFPFTRKTLAGSPHYISPQTFKYTYTKATDIWSLGIIIYKIFHQCFPFQGDDPYVIFRKIKEDEPIIDQKLDSDIHDLILGCLKKNPKQRITIDEIKKHPYFNGVHFSEIYTQAPPITNSIFRRMKTTSNCSVGGILMQIEVEKQMFFGNYKPRLLCIHTKDGQLHMAYKYLDHRIKNQFQLQKLDEIEAISVNEFQIVKGKKKYIFRAKDRSAEDVVTQIREIIANFYQ